jgi:hypothetical protein
MAMTRHLSWDLTTAAQEKHRKLQARREELMRLMVTAGK